MEFSCVCKSENTPMSQSAKALRRRSLHSLRSTAELVAMLEALQGTGPANLSCYPRPILRFRFATVRAM